MKIIGAVALLGLFLLPNLVWAACVSSGSTVVYINGIFTSETQARRDAKGLGIEFNRIIGDSSVTFINGYNPTHIGGFADLVHASAQVLHSSISTFDRDTILLQIHPQVTTRKIMFVGHSQGSFYANELYDYVLAHGQPKAASGVYHVGSPASYVAGGGSYLTSSNDSVINTARTIATEAPNGLIPLAAIDTATGYPTPLEPNITLSRTGNGHGFSGVYLAEAPERIVGDIQNTLNKLKSEAATETGECFSAPSAGLSYQAAKTGYAVADAAASGVKAGFVGAQRVAAAVGNTFLSVASVAFGGDKKAVETQASKLYGTGEHTQEVVGSTGPQESTAADLLDEPQGEVLGAEVAPEEPVIPQIIKRIVYLSGGGSRSSNHEPREAAESTPEPEPIVESVATTTEPVAAAEPTLPAIAEREVVINELVWAGERHWIELYNASSSAIDLSLLYLVVGSAAPVQLSGTIESRQYLVLERAAGSLQGVSPVAVAAFESLATPVQISLKLADGIVVDATPAADACTSWCKGGIGNQYADQNGTLPISMERVSTSESGASPDNWASNDGYTRVGKYANKTEIVGTPARTNSKHWPLVGFFCDNDSTILEPRASADMYAPAGTSCTGLMGTVPFHLSVGGGIFKGTVGSSTMINTIAFTNRTTSYGNQKVGTVSFLPEVRQYFVAFWEYNNGIVGSTVNRIGDMQRYLLTGTKEDGTLIVTAPLAYHLIPFTIE